MPKAHCDTKGYYRSLGVPPTASDSEIRLAFVLLKGTEAESNDVEGDNDEATRAYYFLKNPARRQNYDRSETTGFAPVNLKLKFDDVRVLVATVVLLAGILGFVWVPLYGSRFRSFSAGDRLVNTAGVEFGLVVQSVERHTFPGGTVVPGFLIELPGSKELRWFPASDIKAACRRVK